MRNVQKIYQKRSEHTKKIDRFWHVVLSQHPEFAEYIRSSDFKYLELIKDIYVSWDVSQPGSESQNPGDFSITFEFNSLDDDFPAQTIVKEFKVEVIDPEEIAAKTKSKRKNIDDSEEEDDLHDTERLVSKSVDIIWPKSYDSINPSKITDKKTSKGKKNYRTGMKSFFGWFKWTGLKPAKEFPSGEDFARLFPEDIFPYAVKYYTEAQRDGLEEEDDSDASEPLDLSDNEESRGIKRKNEEDH